MLLPCTSADDPPRSSSLLLPPLSPGHLPHSSYARWAQALHLWDTVRNCSKDLVRQACYWVRDPVRKDMLVRWTAAYSHALMHHVRPDATNLETELARVLLPHEVEAAAAAQPDPTSFVLQVRLQWGCGARKGR